MIGAIEGYAVAGGMELALMCDLRVVAEDTIMGIFNRRFGKVLNRCHPWEEGGGDFHVERLEILVFSLRGVNQRLWSSIGCSGQNVTICSGQGIF